MASTEKAADPESGKEVPPPETRKEAGPPKTAAGAPPCGNLFMADVVLRGLLFAATLTSVVVMVTSKQTQLVPVPVMAGALVPVQAKFNHSPAFIYFVAALSVACVYSIIATLASISLILKPIFTTKFLFHFILLDTVVLGLVASATGTAGGVAYVGLKGNSHVGWGKVCPVYDKFCQHVGSSVAISLFASVLLLLLIFLSTFSLYSRIRRE